MELCRIRVEACRHGNDTVKIYDMRFRQLLNELYYAVQGEHQKRTERSIALKIEEKTTIKRYVMNLRDGIGILSAASVSKKESKKSEIKN